MSKLLDLRPKARIARVAEALDVALRQLDGPAATWDIVAAVCRQLGAEKGDVNRIARDVGYIALTHPMSRATGETFSRYGRVMSRREWLPSHAKNTPRNKIVLDEAELDRRRKVIASHEAEDEWTVHPAQSDFLEDEQ
jgi:hypothetical protein